MSDFFNVGSVDSVPAAILVEAERIRSLYPNVVQCFLEEHTLQDKRVVWSFALITFPTILYHLWFDEMGNVLSHKV